MNSEITNMEDLPVIDLEGYLSQNRDQKTIDTVC